jgi:hypothetical protein
MVRRAFLIAGGSFKATQFQWIIYGVARVSFFWPIKPEARRDRLVFFLRAGPRFCFMANFYPGELPSASAVRSSS